MKKLSMIDEYINHTTEAKKKYGEKTFVCLQGGDFYEILGYDENYEPFQVCRDILCIRIASRNKTESSGFVAGYPMHSSKSFEAKLLMNGYTVVYVNQVKSNNKQIEREITKICSPGCNSSDPLDFESTSLMTSILIEKINNIYFSYLCLYDGNVGVVYIENIGGVDLEQTCSALCSHNYNEVLLTLVEHDNKYNNDEIIEIKNKLNINNSLVHVKIEEFKNIKKTVLDANIYQPTSLNKFFKKFINLYQDIYSNLGIEECSPGDIGAMIILLEFIESRGEDFVKNICKPKLHTISTMDYLKCYHGVYDKLQIIGNKNSKTLLSYLDKTCSQGGSRCLKNYISKPLTNNEKIRYRHSIVQEFVNNKELIDFLKNNLKIVDLERFIRTMSLGNLLPHHIKKIKLSFENIEKINTYFHDQDISYLLERNIWNEFEDFLKEFNNIFNFKNCDISGENIFNINIYPELDKLFFRQKEINNKFDFYCKLLSSYIEDDDKLYVQRKFTDKDGHYFSVTKKRSLKLEKNKNKFESENNEKDLKISKDKASYTSVTFSNSNLLSSELIRNEKTCNELSNAKLKEILFELYEKYGECLKKVSNWIINVDVFYSYSLTALLYNYKKPIVVDSECGSIEAKGLRHPIIERLLSCQQYSYVPNDVVLSSESSYLLYGVNSSGKSSLMKSVGICVIMCQAGMWVPADSLRISSYTKLFLRMGNSDSLVDGHSSFTCEMREANNILRDATSKSLVLADEFCASTESNSATIIVASTLETLALRRASYLFATHLFQLLDLESTKNLPGLYIKHLKVDSTDEGLVFSRKLTNGPPERRDYGVLVGKKICNVPDFLKKLENNSRLVENPSLSFKSKKIRSKYNKSLLLECCSFCGYKPEKIRDLPLETHHIKFQCIADENGYINSFHKNDLHNLVVVCKQCHINIHKDKIKVHGYVQTENGSKLSYDTI